MSVDFYNPYEYHSFINLFHAMAERYSDRCFARYQTPDLTFTALTYEQIDLITTNLACRWSPFLGTTETVGFIGDHSIHYLLSMLALFKLRHTIFALSSRNSEAANVNLMQKTRSKFIFATEKYAHMAKACAAQLSDVDYHIFDLFDIDAMVKEPLYPDSSTVLNTKFGEEDEERIALILHSSGTTSFPKPIRLSNRYLILLLQNIPRELTIQSRSAALKINDIGMGLLPLSHVFGFYTIMGPMIVGACSLYFTRIPPSPHEIISVIEEQGVTAVGLVPLYLDQLMVYLKETGRYQALQKLKYIQFAGAQLKPAIGDFFHTHGINICNVYGSTETSVLSISNHTDRKYWYTLKPVSYVADYIEWEVVDRELGIYHPVVKAGAPFMATGAGNRPNGDIATNDLFMEEPLGSGYYRHLGRKDDTLVMENGEKINPTPMENTIASSTIVRHCTVIGQDRQCPGVLVELDFEQAIRRRPEEMISLVHKAVQDANIEAPSHSTILPEMVYILALDKHLPTTDKGTVNRAKAIETFFDAVEKLYNDFLNGPGPSFLESKDSAASWSLEKTEVGLSQVAAKILQTDDRMLLNVKEESLFDHGLNSLLSIQLRNQIAVKFEGVTSNFVFEYSSIASMAKALVSSGMQTDTLEERYKETQALLDSYLERASMDFSTSETRAYSRDDNDPHQQHQQEVVLLTGATGSLGAFMLRGMLLSSKVRTVYCLVRGKPGELMDRLRKSFSNRRMDVSLLDTHANKVVVLPMNLNADYLGLSREVYGRLKSEVTLVQACAWLVEFNHPVSHFDKECIQGLYKLLQFAHRLVNPMHVHYISSVCATAAMKTLMVPETPSPQDPHVTMSMGYAHSKYIVEHLFDYLTKNKNFPCIIERVGQICGDSENGVWNTNEQYPLIMMGGGAMLAKVPDLKTTVIDWIPVDYAAASIVEIMLKTAKSPARDLIGRVFHIVNPTTIAWADVVAAMKACGLQFDIVSPKEWIKALNNHQDNPAYRLMSYFETTYLNSSSTEKMPVWVTENTVKITPVLGEAPVFGAELMKKYLAYWESVGFSKA